MMEEDGSSRVYFGSNQIPPISSMSMPVLSGKDRITGFIGEISHPSAIRTLEYPEMDEQQKAMFKKRTINARNRVFTNAIHEQIDRILDNLPDEIVKELELALLIQSESMYNDVKIIGKIRTKNLEETNDFKRVIMEKRL